MPRPAASHNPRPARPRRVSSPPMTPQQFIEKWQVSKLKEKAACQSHFADLCALLAPGVHSSSSVPRPSRC